MARVAVILGTYNRKQHLERALASVRSAVGSLPYEIVVVDGGSTDGSREWLAGEADVVLIGSYVTHSWNATSVEAPKAFADLVAQADDGGARAVVVAFGNPYLLQQIPTVPGYMVAWGGLPVSQQAAARALTGRAPIGGRLPIPIPPVAPFGAGIDRQGGSATR